MLTVGKTFRILSNVVTHGSLGGSAAPLADRNHSRARIGNRYSIHRLSMRVR
jgi:hypothetical protein